MMIGRKIRENRAGFICLALVGASLISLVTGTEATLMHRGIKDAVSVVAYPFLKAKRFVGDSVDYAAGFFSQYYTLRRDYGALREEVTGLREALVARNELGRENKRLRKMLDFARTQPRLSLEPVKIIENYKGMLRIDRGSLHGIEPGMPVIAAPGVAGVVNEVSPLSSVVASLHHPDCRIGAMVRRNRLRAYDGIVHAGSDLTSICTMNYIDMNDEVLLGDLVVTSPESLFPSGYPIGTVVAIHDTGTLWKSAEIQPAADPYRLDEAFVIRRAAPEAEEMAGAAYYFAGGNRAPDMPDNRTVQERFAP